MNDIVTTHKRSLMMSGIRGRDTGPELRVRRVLHGLGYRFRLHRKDLPGSPDVVLPKHKVAIFIHGCFWHKHGCRSFRWPETRQDFWRGKLQTNQSRDIACEAALREAGWRVLTIWECAIMGKARRSTEAVISLTIEWLNSEAEIGSIEGT